VLALQLELRGTEGRGEGILAFQDRVLLVVHWKRREEPVFGYAERAYADGRRVIFHLKGWLHPPAARRGGDPLVLVGARYTLSVSGDVVWSSVAHFEMEVAPANGSVRARGN
jgi:hypothetical protein